MGISLRVSANPDTDGCAGLGPEADFRTAYSSFSDVVLAVFPTTVLWNLQMERRIKISLAFVMGLGIL